MRVHEETRRKAQRITARQFKLRVEHEAKILKKHNQPTNPWIIHFIYAYILSVVVVSVFVMLALFITHLDSV